MHLLFNLRWSVLAAALLWICAQPTPCLAQDNKKEATVLTLPNASELSGQFTLHQGRQPLREEFADDESWAEARDRWQEGGRELRSGAQVALPEGHCLMFTGHRGIKDADLAHLKGLTALRNLSLHGCYPITDEGLEHLKSLTALHNLVLHGCYRITDTGLAHLKGLTELRSLDLEWCKLTTDAGLAHLTALTALKTLDLAQCDKITDVGLEHLKGLTALQGVFIAGCEKITAAGVASLKEALPAVRIYR